MHQKDMEMGQETELALEMESELAMYQRGSTKARCLDWGSLGSSNILVPHILLDRYRNNHSLIWS